MSDDDDDEAEDDSEEEADMSDGEADQAQRLAGQAAKAGSAASQQVCSPFSLTVATYKRTCAAGSKAVPGRG